MLLVAFLAAALTVFALAGHHFVSLKTLAEHRLALRALVMQNFLLSILVYVALYIAAVLLMFPAAAALTLTGGFLFGWWLGALLAVLSATTGATLVFLVARPLLGETFIDRTGPWLCKLREGFRRNALSYLLFLRLVPAFPFWFMNLAPALLGVSLRDFILATALGIVPGTLAFAFIGSGLDSVLAEHYQAYLDCKVFQAPAGIPCRFDLSPRSFLTRELIGALILLGIIAILPAVVKRLWKSKASRA